MGWVGERATVCQCGSLAEGVPLPSDRIGCPSRVSEVRARVGLGSLESRVSFNDLSCVAVPQAKSLGLGRGLSELFHTLRAGFLL